MVVRHPARGNRTPDGWNAHYRGDVFECLADMPDWDLMIAHPPCTYLSVSGLHWNKRRPERAAQTEEALEFVARLDRETRHPAPLLRES